MRISQFRHFRLGTAGGRQSLPVRKEPHFYFTEARKGVNPD